MATTKQDLTFSEKVSLSYISRWVEGGKIASRSLSPDIARALFRLESFRGLIQRSFGVRLPPVRRADWSAKSLKEFCEGILDRDCLVHDWRSSLLKQHASLQVRVSVASSLFLFRKVIPLELTPSERKKKIKKYIKKMCSAQLPPRASFLDHAERVTKAQFKEGWDKKWAEAVAGFTPPVSSCVENPRSKGGIRGLDRAALRRAYLGFTDGKYDFLALETKPVIVWTGGKWRLVTKFKAERSFLSPLHQTIYNHLSKKDWLLRGEANAGCFEDFTRKPGEIFVSGDYESATDNLNIHATERVLMAMSSTSRFIPGQVWRAALRCLRNRLQGRDQERGQLMGSLLSFPLLCLLNFISFKWAVPRKVPLKINGDDIVFRATESEKDNWIKEIGQSGLVLSTGKTLVSKTVFSLNSSFFLPKDRSVKTCPIIRSTCLFGACEDVTEIAGRLESVFVGTGVAKRHCQAFALREMSKQVWCSQRSVRRGLGGRVGPRVLKAAGLYDRERFYLGLPTEPQVPIKKKTWSQNAIPENYERRPAVSSAEVDDPDFMKDMIECCWVRPPIIREKEKGYWCMVRDNTFRYVSPPLDKFRRLLMKLPKGLRPQVAYQFPRTKKEKLVWVKALDVSSPPRWISGGLLEEISAVVCAI